MNIQRTLSSQLMAVDKHLLYYINYSTYLFSDHKFCIRIRNVFRIQNQIREDGYTLIFNLKIQIVISHPSETNLMFTSNDLFNDENVQCSFKWNSI